MQSHTTPAPPPNLMSLLQPTKHSDMRLISVEQSGHSLIECQYECVISLFSTVLVFLSPVTSPPAPRAVTVAIIHQLLICCFDNKAGWRGHRESDKEALAKVCSAPYPRWMVRMCLWMPAAVLSTLPQFFHRHLNITFMEFCKKHKVQQLLSETQVVSCLKRCTRTKTQAWTLVQTSPHPGP